MPSITIDQECNLIKHGSTYVIRLKQKNASKVRKFLKKKVDAEITLTTSD